MDQALLALVIQRASRKNGYLGRTAVQKIMYFLKVAGVRMNYRFEIYHYGPFSDGVRSDVGWLIADGVIEDVSPTEEYSNYAPGEAFNLLVDKYEGQLAQFAPTIDAVVSALPLDNPSQMEMTATLDYLYRAEQASRPHGPYKDFVVKRFQEVKHDKFPRKDIEHAYSEMVKVNLFAE